MSHTRSLQLGENTLAEGNRLKAGPMRAHSPKNTRGHLGDTPTATLCPAAMSNRIALILFLTLVVLFGGLFYIVEDAPLFLARKFADLIEWLAFWR